MKIGALAFLFVLIRPIEATATSDFKVDNIEISTSLPTKLKYKKKLPKLLHCKLFLPLDQFEKHSIMIILPSSAGVRTDIEIYYATQLAKNGIAALIVDSLSSRNFTTLNYTLLDVTTSDYEMDAYAAQNFIIHDKRFDETKIGVMGVSRGGSASHLLALNVRKRWRGSQNYHFAAHVSIAPSCFQYHLDSSTDGNPPMFFMLAELDDESPPKDCMVIVNNLIDAGNKNIKVKIYKGAYHAWEVLGKPIFEKYNVLANRCYYTMTEEQKIIPKGTSIHLELDEWGPWAIKNCVYKGTTIGGGTPELKRRATNDLLEFLKTSGFKPPLKSEASKITSQQANNCLNIRERASGNTYPSCHFKLHPSIY